MGRRYYGSGAAGVHEGDVLGHPVDVDRRRRTASRRIRATTCSRSTRKRGVSFARRSWLRPSGSTRATSQGWTSTSHPLGLSCCSMPSPCYKRRGSTRCIHVCATTTATAASSSARPRDAQDRVEARRRAFSHRMAAAQAKEKPARR